MDCIFCKIANKEISAEVIFDNDDAVAFLDLHPLAPGHTVVISKAHVDNITELEDGMVGGVFLAVKKVTAMLKKAFSPDGFTIGINHGRFSGHTAGVDHLHIHVVPRWRSDRGVSVHGMVKNPPKESIKEIKDKILNTK